MIKILSESEFIQEALPPLLKLCGTCDPNPFGEPFLKNIERKLLLFKYFLIPDLNLMEKIHKSVQENYQDSGFYIASLGCTSFQNNLPQTKLYLSFSDYKEYYEQSHTYNMYIIENILYSPKGEWGIVSSDEFHCVIGGSINFTSSLEKQIPNLNDQLIDFLEFWKSYFLMNSKLDLSWLKLLIPYIYGDIEGEKILKKHGFEYLFNNK